MKTKYFWIYPIAIIGLLLTFTFGCEKDDDFEGGRGTQDDPYLIATPKQLDGVRHNLNKHFRQIADIDLSGYSSGEGWNPIGDERNPFTGIFDGNGHKITNLRIKPRLKGGPEASKEKGLFGNAKKSTIKNLFLSISAIEGHALVGGLVGRNGGDIINCYVTGNIKGHFVVGGLAGDNDHGKITNSYFTGNVSGEYVVGGLVGSNKGKITNSYANGNVPGGWNDLGGLAGSNEGEIINCYATGNVRGNEMVGGLVGGNIGAITNCYAIGVVSGEDFVGGLVGANKWEILEEGEYTYYDEETSGVTFSYYNKVTTGQEDTGKGVPKTTVEMMQQSTFETWDFTNIWNIDEGNSYPYLQWQVE